MWDEEFFTNLHTLTSFKSRMNSICSSYLIGDDGDDGAPVPALFSAVTRNSYPISGRNPLAVNAVPLTYAIQCNLM